MIKFGLDSMHGKRYKSGFYDAELQIYKNILLGSKDAVFVDAGANIGYFSEGVSPCCASVHAFEPVSSVYEILIKNCESSLNVVCNPFALGTENKKQAITKSVVHNQGHTFDKRIVEKFSNIFEHQEEEVQVIRLEDYAVKTGMKTITLLKVDTEGAELEVVSGLGNFINNVKNIVFESYFTEDIEKIKKLTKDAGFSNITKLGLPGAPTFLVSRS